MSGRQRWWIGMAAIAAVLPFDEALAQQSGSSPPELIIGGRPPPPVTREDCVEVEIGGERSLSCLNQRLKRDVDRAGQSPNLPPLDAHSPDTRIGIANVPAVQQQYGKNFGNSVIPYRPPAPVYGVPRR
jgi:hypothetical protein